MRHMSKKGMDTRLRALALDLKYKLKIFGKERLGCNSKYRELAT